MAETSLRIEQVKIAFPIASAAEYRWRYQDGSWSAWGPSPGGIIKMPPAAKGFEIRERFIPRKAARPKKMATQPA